MSADNGGADMPNEPIADNTEITNTDSSSKKPEAVTVVSATPKSVLEEDKDTSVLELNDTTVIYSDTLKKIKEDGIVAQINMPNNVTWTIDGNTMNGSSLSDIDLGVTIGADSTIPQDALTQLTSGEKYVTLSLSHDGEFGFDATLTLPIDEGKSGQYANLFYYNEESGQFEFMCASVINSARKAAFTFKHASEYIIIISDESKEKLLETKAAFTDVTYPKEETTLSHLSSNEGNLSKTDSYKRIMLVILIVTLCIVATVIGTLIFRKKEDEYDD